MTFDYCASFLLLSQLLLFCLANTPDNNEDVESLDIELIEGDIVPSPQQARMSHIADTITGARHERAVMPILSRKWVNGIIPYQLSNDFNDSAKVAITTAMRQITLDTNFCVTFRHKGRLDLDFVHFIQGSGCYSSVGRQGGQQNISIGNSCDSKGVVMHELMHALGRWHEQSRPDRDEYVSINTQNIRAGFLNNFQVVEDGVALMQRMSYDFDSIMHYDAFAFTANTKPTISPVDESVALSRLGQRVQLSTTDILRLKNVYCSEVTSSWSRWSSWNECSTSCGRGNQVRTRVCLGEGDCSGSSTGQRDCNNVDCPIEERMWGPWSEWSGCSRTCGKGERSRIHECVRIGQQCEGEILEIGECNLQACRVASEWSGWSKWSGCSLPCVEGEQRQRTRKCLVIGSETRLSDTDCLGGRLEREPCYVNLPCGNTSYNYSRERCKGNGLCPEDTCLSGILYIGCYVLPQDHFRYLELVNISNLVEDTPERSQTYDDKISKNDIVKACGKITQRGDDSIFGTRGNLCLIGPSNRTIRLTEERSSQLCKDEGSPRVHLEGEVLAINVYQIVDRQNFELSVRAYESCGSNFCRLAGYDEQLLCSAGTRAKHHLLTALLQLMFILWSLLPSLY